MRNCDNVQRLLEEQKDIASELAFCEQSVVWLMNQIAKYLERIQCLQIAGTHVAEELARAKRQAGKKGGAT